MAPTLTNRFTGSLLGLAVGDALGGRFEAQSAEGIRRRFPTVAKLMAYPTDELWYTDDTQMAIGVAEALIACGEIRGAELCAAFVANYDETRGYGRGARAVLEAMADGVDYRIIARRYFPGGSYGNGAAMRVAPVGLFFHDDEAAIWEQARRSALPTHLHPLGIEGAQLLALAVALAVKAEPFDREAFFDRLLGACVTPEFRAKLELARGVRDLADLAALGNGIEALESVPTAIAGFALSPTSYEDAVGNAILLGGDTDTIAAMTGALSGAYLGVEGVPARLVALLEATFKGREYISALGGRLYEAMRSNHG